MDRKLVEEIEMLYQQVCQALGDPKRLMLLYILDGKPRNVTELAAELELPQPTVSRHLKILRERLLVTTYREGAAVYYSLTDSRLTQALDILRAIVRDRLHEQAALADFTALDAERAHSHDD